MYPTIELKAVRSPLRVCPIGAHSDYQGGKVTGMTIDASVDMVYAPREDGYVNIKSMDFPDKEYFHLTHDLEWIVNTKSNKYYKVCNRYSTGLL